MAPPGAGPLPEVARERPRSQSMFAAMRSRVAFESEKYQERT
jgi:hypothetical protein